LTGQWIAHDLRDELVDFVQDWSKKTEIAYEQLLRWIELSSRKFRDWRERYGKVTEHNHQVPRDHWLEKWEKEAIVKFFHEYPLEGYRRLCFMMLDRDMVAVSPASVYRVLKAEGLLANRWQKPTRKGSGFVQPLEPHEHWHIDFSYVNVGGTFYYLCSILDGCSRAIVHWEIREAMKEADAELVLQRAREKHPQARPRIISDNGPQFVAKDFREFLRLWQTSHVFTSPHYPQSNGKLERYHRTLKEQAIRPKTPLTLEDARRVVGEFVEHYNAVRLHSALGYVTPQDRLAGRHTEIYAARDRKLEAAREQRRQRRANLEFWL
jgi:transposase InsO family protein